MLTLHTFLIDKYTNGTMLALHLTGRAIGFHRVVIQATFNLAVRSTKHSFINSSIRVNTFVELCRNSYTAHTSTHVLPRDK